MKEKSPLSSLYLKELLFLTNISRSSYFVVMFCLIFTSSLDLLTAKNYLTEYCHGPKIPSAVCVLLIDYFFFHGSMFTFRNVNNVLCESFDFVMKSISLPLIPAASTTLVGSSNTYLFNLISLKRAGLS